MNYLNNILSFALFLAISIYCLHDKIKEDWWLLIIIAAHGGIALVFVNTVRDYIPDRWRLRRKTAKPKVSIAIEEIRIDTGNYQ